MVIINKVSRLKENFLGDVCTHERFLTRVLLFEASHWKVLVLYVLTLKREYQCFPLASQNIM